jgi:hypothetical protein
VMTFLYHIIDTKDERVLISGRGCSSHVTTMYHIGEMEFAINVKTRFSARNHVSAGFIIYNGIAS